MGWVFNRHGHGEKSQSDDVLLQLADFGTLKEITRGRNKVPINAPKAGKGWTLPASTRHMTMNMGTPGAQDRRASCRQRGISAYLFVFLVVRDATRFLSLGVLCVVCRYDISLTSPPPPLPMFSLHGS